MAVDNSYEEARNQRLQENKKRFEDLGIVSLSKDLSKLASSPRKSKPNTPKPRAKATGSETVEPRRSTRARNLVSYHEEVDIDFLTLRKRPRSSSTSDTWERYCSRPIDEVRLASYEERACALKAAEDFRSSLQSGNPSFVKSMVRSHVYSCFWLALPTQFCKNHMPKSEVDMTLEEEDGSAYDAKYLGHKNGLSGGWRGFALHKKLDDGDAVVFELVEQEKFKVYIFRVSSFVSSQNLNAKNVEKKESNSATRSELEEKTQPAKLSKVEVDENVEVSKDRRQTRKKTVGKKLSENVSSKKKNDLKNEKPDENSTENEGEEAKVQSEKDKRRIANSGVKPRKRFFRKRA